MNGIKFVGALVLYFCRDLYVLLRFKPPIWDPTMAIDIVVCWALTSCLLINSFADKISILSLIILNVSLGDDS